MPRWSQEERLEDCWSISRSIDGTTSRERELSTCPRYDLVAPCCYNKMISVSGILVPEDRCLKDDCFKDDPSVLNAAARARAATTQ